MKYILTTLLLAAVVAVSPAKAGDSVNNNPGDGRPLQESSTMTSVSFGEHAKMSVLPSEREGIQKFYRDVLGCQVTTESKRDRIRLGTNYYIAFIYEDSALSKSDLLKSIWLELRTDHPEELKQKILKFGIKEIESPDKEHFIFQAPGGQVFRLAGKTEDLSKYER